VKEKGPEARQPFSKRKLKGVKTVKKTIKIARNREEWPNRREEG
jgi:hypothetical protein